FDKLFLNSHTALVSAQGYGMAVYVPVDSTAVAAGFWVANSGLGTAPTRNYTSESAAIYGPLGVGNNGTLVCQSAQDNNAEIINSFTSPPYGIYSTPGLIEFQLPPTFITQGLYYAMFLAYGDVGLVTPEIGIYNPTLGGTGIVDGI